MESATQAYDLDLKVAELQINGYVLFEELIPQEKIDQIREAFLPLLEAVRARHDPVESGEIHKGRGRLQHTNRYTVEVPWAPPFADPAIYESPVLLAFLDRYWGSDDYQITCFSSNNPYPGSAYQNWHLDAGITRAMPHVSLQTCPHFGVKFPLVDTTEENGSFEILPCTQYIANPELEAQFNTVLEQGDFPSKQRLNMKRGTLWVQDPRAVHRGTPNRSSQPRPELVLCFSRPWFAVRRQIEMTRTQFEGLSDRGKHLLSRCRIIEG